ncbi:bifunctional cystathionine gamma-lyase/homocysteine desulfhydrase [Alkalicoccobacillus porphyridii]|uniref:Bifunctional cystathionine gamma-lyase/homocysteine desulfhydrase n=1 Tax=Alkalicoccobacillus porphyridii TaxID=2597270 RepID=A0A554A390_9BACI|nr:bifunctional cystathionine gamma-lyase/homocysteine desulfhydrase [Alkalicoccobacillus porphyridii]TSB48160.1 bifunctional cystathionine gamma-lyase/homocysteine desulfhydrase [Alkalicoccobacillus porphyridii]
MRRKTKLIHGGIPQDQHTGGVSFPIQLSSTFKQKSIGDFNYEYARTGNPTREALEKLIAELEDGNAGFAFASGMAAITTVCKLFSQGDHLLFSEDVYGGTYRLVVNVLSKEGITADFVDTTDLNKVEKTLQNNTKAIFLETPTNPLLTITDIASISKWAQDKGLLTIVDNTFATPYWQNPLQLGADVVLHSATKYLGGHSDVLAGLVVVHSKALADEIGFLQNATGAVLGAQDSWLLIRGIRTLAVRMEEIESHANQVATFLQQHSTVPIVYYPGLPTHTGYELHHKQSRGSGGILSFECGSEERVSKILSSLSYFTLAESLGAVESLISVPAKMTHASIPAERRKELGITDGLIRLSIGLEDPDDLIEDLERALKK